MSFLQKIHTQYSYYKKVERGKSIFSCSKVILYFQYCDIYIIKIPLGLREGFSIYSVNTYFLLDAGTFEGADAGAAGVELGAVG